MRPVPDPADPGLDDYRGLKDGPARAGGTSGTYVVEGVIALRRVVSAGLPLRSVVLTPPRAASLPDLVEQLDPSVEVMVAERAVLEEACGVDVHRGVLAAGIRPASTDPHELIGTCRRVVVADGLNDHENLGALFRNAAGLGIGAVLLDDRCADPLYRRSVRVSLGWAAALPHARLARLPGGLDLLHDAGFRTVALTPSHGATPVDRAAADGALDDPVALVVGAEGPGLDPSTIRACTAQVRIPMYGHADSLNVATALAVAAAFAASRSGWA